MCLSPTLRQSSELFRNVTRFYGLLACPTESRAESALKLELANGSRIISLPGQEATVRGYAGVNLLIIDEAARVSDELYYSVRSMLAVSGGRLIALSTPWGKRGWFYQEWTSESGEGMGWQKVSITADQCPWICKEFLEQEKRTMPRSWFEAEYICAFTEPEDSVFGYDEVMRAIDGNVETLEV